LLTLVGGLASPIFIPVAGLLAGSLGWRPTVLLMGLCQLLVCLPIHALVLRRHPEDLGQLPDGRRAPATEVHSPSHGAAAGEALRRPAFWTLTASSLLGLLAVSALFAHLVPYL